MVIFNALLNLSELKELYSGKPVCVCPLYNGVLNTPKTFEATGNLIVLPEYKSLVKLTTKFLPKQAGTGDPSPENVRPISGYDEVAVNVWGKNLVDYTKAQPRNNSQTVEIIPNGVKWSGDFYFKIPIIGLPKGSTIVFSCTTELNTNWYVHYTDNSLSYQGKNGKPLTLDQNKTTKELYIYTKPPEQPVTDAIITNIQLEFGSTPTPYEPYQPGTTSTITFPETIYGGTVDAVTGVGSKTWGYIASYNGESLPGEWISDRDVYAPGTTPTTGAQVAYKLATPEYFKVSQVSIPSLRGENYFFTNGENMDIIYKKESFWSDEA